MELSGRLVNHLLSSPASLWVNNLVLTSSWSTSSRLVQSMNQSKCSSAAYPLSPVNCLSIWAYPLGRSCRTTERSIWENLLAFVGVIAELWRTVKLNEEGFLSSEVVGDKTVAENYSLIVDFTEANSEVSGGCSWSNKWEVSPYRSSVGPWVS